MTIDDTLHWDKLKSVGSSPGYGDASLRLVLHTGREIEINLTASDARLLRRRLEQVAEFDSGLSERVEAAETARRVM